MATTEAPFRHIRVTIIDGVGCGPAANRMDRYPDDVNANSLLNASQHEPLDAPALLSLGLARVPGLENMRLARRGDIYVRGAFGALTPTFAGNGSPEGHQALMGNIVREPYMLFNTEEGFPPLVIDLVETTVADVMGRSAQIVRYPGTDDVNGVKFINHPGIGDVHYASREGEGPLIVPIYASSDSLIQVALHQGVVPQEQIEQIGKALRAAVDKKGFRIGRIIMRPFTGGPDAGSFTRVSSDRKDYGVDPDGPTVVDHLAEIGVPVYGVGKAASMLNNYGFEAGNIRKLGDDEERLQAIVDTIASQSEHTVSFSLDNIIGTDELYGHPRKPIEYMRHIGMVDRYIAQGMSYMKPTDLWIFTSDHGNDPTQDKHTNHTNERTFVVVYHRGMHVPVNLGVRNSFADVAATVADNFGIEDRVPSGTSFLRELL